MKIAMLAGLAGRVGNEGYVTNEASSEVSRNDVRTNAPIVLLFNDSCEAWCKAAAVGVRECSWECAGAKT